MALRLGALALLAAAAAPQGAAAEPPAMAILFDATNSMWGQIDGVNKVVHLRKALGRAFEAAEGKLDMGVMSYGSNEEATCTAINTVQPLGPVNADEYSRAVSRTPLGKGGTPLGRGLTAAAAHAEYETRPATLVVITDGADNCRGDPCAAAAELEAASPGLTVHAIAFDKDKQKLSSLSCMAKATGGVFFAATNGPELDSALDAIIANATQDAVLQLGDAPAAATSSAEAPAATASAETPAAAGAGESTAETAAPLMPVMRPTISPADGAAEPSAQTAALTEPEVERTGTLRLSARLTEEMPLIHNDLVWRVFSAEPEDDGSFKVLAQGEDARPEFPLRAGDYVVHVGYGRAGATKRVTLEEGVHDEVLVLNAGGLRLKAVGPDGSPLSRNAVSFAVYSSEQDQFGQRELLLPAVPPGRTVRLNAGSYHIVSQYGDANAVVRADVTVEAGKVAEAMVSHEAAKVTLKLVNQPGGEALANTSWSVETPEGDLVAQSVGAFPTHILAPGPYTIVARHDGTVYSRKYTVELGYDQEVEIVSGAGE